MHIDKINIIGYRQSKRDDAKLADVNEVIYLKKFLEMDNLFDDFYNIKNISFKQWIYAKAMDIYNGKKIDFRCTCCEYSKTNSSEISSNCKNIKCYGVKIASLVNKLLEDIEKSEDYKGIDREEDF
tara:strand:- start:30 stop:407 length:378 start_codon:yes stop_codon:yes gene_type:complete